MDSLIAYIAQEHNLKRENLATQILDYILRSAKDSVLQGIFAHYGLILPSNSAYQIHAQRRGTESRCIPDIQIKDEYGKTRALIECKFQAGFTDHQQRKSYLMELEEGGLLLFVVPEGRQVLAFEKLSKLYGSLAHYNDYCADGSGRTRVVIDGKVLEVTSWGDMLNTLGNSVEQNSPERHQTRLCSYIKQLRRFCEVADKETFLPLTADQISGVGTATLIRHLTWLARELITKCRLHDIIQEAESPNRRSRDQRWEGFDSSLFFGQNVRLCGIDIWMGFWACAWEDRFESPLWIELYPQDFQDKQMMKQIQENKDAAFSVKHEFSADNETWVIPIPIKPDIPQDEVVDEAFRFVSGLKISIEKMVAGSSAKGQ